MSRLITDVHFFLWYFYYELFVIVFLLYKLEIAHAASFCFRFGISWFIFFVGIKILVAICLGFRLCVELNYGVGGGC